MVIANCEGDRGKNLSGDGFKIEELKKGYIDIRGKWIKW